MAVSAILFAHALSGGWPGSGRNAAGAAGRKEGVVVAFHGGAAPAVFSPDPTCGAHGCHPVSPHRRKRQEAAFLNMHAGLVECLGCHGRDEERRRGREPREAGPRVGYDLPAGRGEPHTLIGKPASCRGCHSPQGRARLEAAGAGGLSSGFSDPVPLRMMEKGARRWVPHDLR